MVEALGADNSVSQRPIPGAPAKENTKGKKVKEKAKRQNVIGDCIHWSTKSQRERRDSCGLKHDHDKIQKLDGANLIFLANQNSEKKFKRLCGGKRAITSYRYQSFKKKRNQRLFT